MRSFEFAVAHSIHRCPISHAAKLNFCIIIINQTVLTRIHSVAKIQSIINKQKFNCAKMMKFLIFIVLFSFIPWFQVTYCDEIELDSEFSEFLSKFPFNLDQALADSNKNETNDRTEVFYGSQCFIDIQRIYIGMATRKLWAFKGNTISKRNQIPHNNKSASSLRFAIIIIEWMKDEGLLCPFFEYKRRTRKFHLWLCTCQSMNGWFSDNASAIIIVYYYLFGR